MFDWVLNTPLDPASRSLKYKKRSHSWKYTDLGIMISLNPIKETIKTNHLTLQKISIHGF